jgi:hypothetical protein
MTSRTLVSSRLFLWSLALVTALALRAGREYRAFPAPDDLVYVPLVWAAGDPALYPRDTLVQEYQFLLHAPLWRVMVVTAESTLGLPWAFWIATTLLTIASVLAVAWLLRLMGAAGYFLPVAAVLAYGASVGLGRGKYDGALGYSVQIQWVALCLLLWCYGAFAQGRQLAAGALLGVAFLAHPQVALHGAFVVTVAALAHVRSAIRAISITAATAAVVGAPAIIPIVRSLVPNQATIAWSDADLIRLGYLFRLAGEYTFESTSVRDVLLIAALGVSGVAGALLLRRAHWSRPTRVLVGVFTGHALLLMATVVHLGNLGPDSWRDTWLLPYLLGLSRTTPLFGVLGGTIAAAAVEQSLDRDVLYVWARRIRSTRGVETALSWHTGGPLSATLAAIIGVALFTSRYPDYVRKLVYLIPVVVGAFGWLRARRGQSLTSAGIVASAVAVGCLGWEALYDRKVAPVAAEEAGLFEWAQLSTPGPALFIVPPGMEEFRFYARRSVYVDLKLFSPAVPRAAPVWRMRLEEIADPDTATLQSRGWPSIESPWDRRYAARNTPERIAWLLRTTGADYFVSQVGLPGAASISDDALASARLASAYGNDRYNVYRLADP